MGASLSLESPTVTRESSGFTGKSAISFDIVANNILSSKELEEDRKTNLSPTSPGAPNHQSWYRKKSRSVDSLIHIRMESLRDLSDPIARNTSSMHLGKSNDHSIGIVVKPASIAVDKKITLPFNPAIAALRKKHANDLGSSSRSSSIEDFLAKPPGSSSSRKAYKENPITQSPATVKRKTSLFELRLVKLSLNLKYHPPQLESVTIERLGDLKDSRKRKDIIQKYRMKKFNSTSTLFLESSILNSDLDDYLKYYANYIQATIHRLSNADASAHTVDILSEKLNPLSKTIQFYKKPISRKDIFRYLECMFQSAELGVENVLITMIYVDRFLESSKVIIQGINWARILLGGVILASKVWDDHAIWNIDFCQIFPDVESTDLNELEAYFLDVLKFDVSVKISNYTKAYFKVKEDMQYSFLPWALEPLLTGNAQPVISRKESEKTQYEDSNDSITYITDYKLRRTRSELYLIPKASRQLFLQ